MPTQKSVHVRCPHCSKLLSVGAALCGKTVPCPNPACGKSVHLIGHGFAKMPVLEGAGRAAGEVYAWAIENPGKVSCVYAENPVLRSHMSKKPLLDSLAPLAKANVPLLHVCGSLDPGLKDQTLVVEKRSKELGGHITVIINEGVGHYPLAPRDRRLVADFIIKKAK